jgi:hypothetical protein
MKNAKDIIVAAIKRRPGRITVKIGKTTIGGAKSAEELEKLIEIVERHDSTGALPRLEVRAPEFATSSGAPELSKLEAVAKPMTAAPTAKKAASKKQKKSAGNQRLSSPTTRKAKSRQKTAARRPLQNS